MLLLPALALMLVMARCCCAVSTTGLFCVAGAGSTSSSSNRGKANQECFSWKKTDLQLNCWRNHSAACARVLPGLGFLLRTSFCLDVRAWYSADVTSARSFVAALDFLLCSRRLYSSASRIGVIARTAGSIPVSRSIRNGSGASRSSASHTSGRRRIYGNMAAEIPQILVCLVTNGVLPRSRSSKRAVVLRLQCIPVTDG